MRSSQTSLRARRKAAAETSAGISADFLYDKYEGHLEKFFSPSRCESDSLIAMDHGRMERASHGADGLFRY